MNRKPSSRVRRPIVRPGALLLIAVVLGSGCGKTAAPSDKNVGRDALQTVLDAWKGGSKPETLAQRTPPIHVSDGDWKSGASLQSYEAGEGKLIGSDVSYNVVLELKDAKGKVVKKDAVYAVTTRPQLLVLRQDSL